MKHLLFWTYFAIVSYFLFGAVAKPTSDSLVRQAQVECKDVKQLDGQQMYCMAFFIKGECEKGLDLKICGRTER